MHPELGWPMRELLAKGDSDEISQAIRQAIIDGENRVNHSDIEVKVERPQGGLMGVAVTYSIKNDNNRKTLKIDIPLDL